MTMKQGRVNASQLFGLGIISMLATLLLTLPGELLRQAGRGAWWTPLVAAVPAVPLAYAVGKRAGKQGDAVALLRRLLGPFVGRVLLLLVWLAVAIDMAIITREVAEGTSASFSSAIVPVPVLVMLVLVPGMWLAWLGPMVIGRVATMISAGIIVSCVVGFLAVVPLMHVLWTRPVIPTDARFLGGAPMELSWLWLIEPALVGTLIMHEVQPSARRMAGGILAGATASGAILLSGAIWLVIADFGPIRAAEFSVPILHIARELPYSMYLERLDSLVIAVGILGALVKVGLFLWIWAHVSEGIVRVRTAYLLPSLAVANGISSIGMFANPLALDRSIYSYGLYILPTFFVFMAVSYLPGRTWASRSPV